MTKMLSALTMMSAAYATLSSPIEAKQLECEWTTKVQCTDQGCVRTKPTIRSKIDLDASTYSRCDTSGCDRLAANIVRSGTFTIVDLPGRGAFAKIADDGQASEVVTIMSSVLVSHGRCR